MPKAWVIWAFLRSLGEKEFFRNLLGQQAAVKKRICCGPTGADPTAPVGPARGAAWRRRLDVSNGKHCLDICETAP